MGVKPFLRCYSTKTLNCKLDYKRGRIGKKRKRKKRRGRGVKRRRRWRGGEMGGDGLPFATKLDGFQSQCPGTLSVLTQH